MIPERDLDMEMPPIDDSTADRLLSGRLSPHDAPPGYAALAAMIQAATGPANPAELARETAIVAAGVAAVVAAPGPLPAVARRKSMLAKLLSAKVAAVAAVAVLGAGTAAAAISGSLPTQTSHASSHAKPGLTTATSHLPTASTSGHASTANASTSKTGATSSTGPVAGMANGQATFGLCTALLAGSNSHATSNTSSGQDSSTAFKALIAAHGGSVSTATTFCKSYVATNHPGNTPTSTGKPANAGKPASTGKPPTAGDSASHASATTPNSGGTNTAGSASGGASNAGSANATAHMSR
jgi:hypothetical protein